MLNRNTLIEFEIEWIKEYECTLTYKRGLMMLIANIFVKVNDINRNIYIEKVLCVNAHINP